MSNIFLVGCTHFGHENMYKFLNRDGTRVRHQFFNSKDGDEAMIENWNKTVKNNDKVYMLGDVAFTKDALSTMKKLTGKKILIKGNHDNLQLSEYVKYFKDIRATHRLDNEILSHIPLHPKSLWRERKKSWLLNIHAHLHAGSVLEELPTPGGEFLCNNDYFSVCVERINYTPISIDEIRNLTKIKNSLLALRKGKDIKPPKDKDVISLLEGIGVFTPKKIKDIVILQSDDLYIDISKMIVDISINQVSNIHNYEEKIRKILLSAKENIKSLRHHIELMSKCRVTSTEMMLLQQKSEEMAKLWKVADLENKNNSDEACRYSWEIGKDE